MAEKIKGWAESVKTLAGVAHKQPQSAYAVLQKSLQQEWEFVQRVTSGIGDSSGPVEEALQRTFLPDLFQGLEEGALGIGVTHLLVKQKRLALTDPTNMSPENWTASCVIAGHLIAALRGQEEFRTADHSAYLRE